MKSLEGKVIAILATDGFEQIELFSPKEALEKAGAEVHVIAPHGGNIKGWNHTKWGKKVKVDKTIKEAKFSDYDALMLPGGVMNPDHLREDKAVVAFVKKFTKGRKPIAAICHAPQTLIETGFIKGKTLTSYPSLKTDLENAGAKWVDKKVVVDKGLVTSRKPEDLAAFNKKMIEEFAEGTH